MHTAMASTRTKRPAAKPRTPKTDGRRKSLLTRVGDEAMRAKLLEVLREHDWQLTEVATALEMTGASNVIRAIKQFDLVGEYEKARKAGKIRPGVKAS